MVVETTEQCALRVLRESLHHSDTTVEVVFERDDLWEFVWGNLPEAERRRIKRVDAIVIPPMIAT